MDNTNKQFIVRQYTGIEEIIINQTGSGYNEDIPPTIIIDSDGGTDARLQAVMYLLLDLLIPSISLILVLDIQVILESFFLTHRYSKRQITMSPLLITMTM